MGASVSCNFLRLPGGTPSPPDSLRLPGGATAPPGPPQNRLWSAREALFGGAWGAVAFGEQRGVQVRQPPEAQETAGSA
eukprot:1810482-Alexandrium_andersonii.AAC.1